MLEEISSPGFNQTNLDTLKWKFNSVYQTKNLKGVNKVSAKLILMQINHINEGLI